MCFCTPSIRTPFCPSCNVAMFQRIKELQTQLESEKVSHAAWEKQSLLEYSELMQERDAFESDISTIAQHNIELMQERDAFESDISTIAQHNIELMQERDAFESDISTIAQHNIELMQERDALRDALVTIGDTRPGSISFLDLQVFARKVLAALKEE